MAMEQLKQFMTPDRVKAMALWRAQHEERGCYAHPRCADVHHVCECICSDHECLSLYHPPVSCHACKDTGWVPSTIGARPCPGCTSPEDEEAFTLKRLVSGVEAWEIQGVRLSQLDPKTEPRVTAVAWLTEQPTPFLLLSGSRGTGKSHAAFALARTLVLRRQLRTYINTAPDLLGEIKRMMNPEEEGSPEGVIQRAITADLMVLDDLGAERETDYAAECLYRIVDGRYRRKGLTIITTNLRPKDFPETRLWSRVSGVRHTTIVVTSGPDRRKAQR